MRQSTIFCSFFNQPKTISCWIIIYFDFWVVSCGWLWIRWNIHTTHMRPRTQREIWLNIYPWHILFFWYSCVFVWNMAGVGYQWHYLLDTSLGYREKGTCFHSNIHTICSHYNSHLLSVLVERNPSLGKVHTQPFLQWTKSHTHTHTNKRIYL